MVESVEAMLICRLGIEYLGNDYGNYQRSHGNNMVFNTVVSSRGLPPGDVTPSTNDIRTKGAEKPEIFRETHFYSPTCSFKTSPASSS